MLLSAGRVVSVRVVDCVPLSVAVIVAVSSAGTPVTVAVNCALDWPLSTVTFTGVVTFELLSDRPIVVFDEAFPFRVTVHVEFPAALKALGVQLSPLRPAGGTRAICALFVTPFKEPLTDAVSLTVTVPVETVNGAVDEPLGIVTLAGVFN
jgi:hypothetical protein